MKISTKDFFSKCDEIRSLVTIIEEIPNGKLHFLCSEIQKLKPPGNCSLCLTNLMSRSCKQVQKTTTFKSQQTKKIYKIFHNVNCASSYVIHLMECILCNKQ